MRKYRVLFWIVVLSMGLISCSQSSHMGLGGSRAGSFERIGTTQAAAYSFLQDLQQAVATNDRMGVANLVAYPLQINGQDNAGQVQSHQIVSRHQLIKQYSQLFTASVRRAILSQKSETLFANSQGLMIGNGQVWCAVRGKSAEDLYITVINTKAPAVHQP